MRANEFNVRAKEFYAFYAGKQPCTSFSIFSCMLIFFKMAGQWVQWQLHYPLGDGHLISVRLPEISVRHVPVAVCDITQAPSFNDDEPAVYDLTQDHSDSDETCSETETASEKEQMAEAEAAAVVIASLSEIPGEEQLEHDDDTLDIINLDSDEETADLPNLHDFECSCDTCMGVHAVECDCGSCFVEHLQ